MKASTSFAGLNGWIWFLGVVENRNDPIMMGRVQARIFGWHTDNLQMIPTADLSWCQQVNSPNAWNVSYVPHEGEWILGFFVDGEAGQVPFYFGVIPAIPHIIADPTKGFSDPRTAEQISASPNAAAYPQNLDEPTTSRLFRNQNIAQTIVATINNALKTGVSIAGDGSWDQPKSSYAAVHPYNEVKETESGHIMEFDDTKGAERINIYHKSGTYEELRPDGSRVINIKSKNFQIILDDDNIYVAGKYNLTADGDMNLKSGGNLNMVIASDAKVTIGGDLKTTVSGDVTAIVQGSVTATVNGSMDATITGDTSLTSPNINLTGDVNITGDMLLTGDLTASGGGITTSAGSLNVQQNITSDQNIFATGNIDAGGDIGSGD